MATADRQLQPGTGFLELGCPGEILLGLHFFLTAGAMRTGAILTLPLLFNGVLIPV